MENDILLPYRTEIVPTAGTTPANPNDFSVGFKQAKDVTETNIKKEQLPYRLPLKMVALKIPIR